MKILKFDHAARVVVPVLGVYGKPEVGTLTDEMLYGMAVKILEEGPEWAFIRSDYGYEGYVRRSALEVWNREPDAWIGSGFADVMDRPAFAAGILETWPRGAQTVTGAHHGDWVEVPLRGNRTGYLRREHLVDRTGYIQEDEQTVRGQIIELAGTYLGTQYRWGGKSPLGIDCSGLTSIIYYLNGIAIYRDAQIEERFGMHRITLEEAKPADLLYFPGHVALYLGAGQYLHSTGASAGVVINSLVPGDPLYREDLHKSLSGIATVWKEARS